MHSSFSLKVLDYSSSVQQHLLAAIDVALLFYPGSGLALPGTIDSTNSGIVHGMPIIKMFALK